MNQYGKKLEEMAITNCYLDKNLEEFARREAVERAEEERLEKFYDNLGLGIEILVIIGVAMLLIFAR